VLLADAGCWHKEQMENIVTRGIQVLIPPDAGKRKAHVRAGTAAHTRTCDECSRPILGARFTENVRR